LFRVNLFKSSIDRLKPDSLSLGRYFFVGENCKIMGVPFVYLSVPMNRNEIRVIFWKELIVKVKKKLS